jgi:hypothetical protein
LTNVCRAETLSAKAWARKLSKPTAVLGPGVGVRVGSGVSVGGSGVRVGAARGLSKSSQAVSRIRLQNESKTRTLVKAPLLNPRYIDAVFTISILPEG